MKPPVARSLTSVWLIGVPSNWKSAMSLASGSLAMVSWYLIDRACFSLISAAFDGSRHDVGWWRGFTLPSQDVEHDIGGIDAMTEGFGTGGFHRGQTVGQHRVEDVD